jgi:predicted metal-dependent hydrolase
MFFMTSEIIQYKEVNVAIKYKKIKNLRLSISRNTRTVNLSSPYYVNKSIILNFIEDKYDWINNHLNTIPTLKRIDYTIGANIQILGNEVTIVDNQCLIRHKQDYVNYTLSKIDQYSPFLGVHVKGIKVKSLKSKWGSCNIGTQIITLNWYLAHAPLEVLDYVIYHEMCHLLVRGHNKKFYSHIVKKFPNYKLLDAKLKDLQMMI